MWTSSNCWWRAMAHSFVYILQVIGHSDFRNREEQYVSANAGHIQIGYIDRRRCSFSMDSRSLIPIQEVTSSSVSDLWNDSCMLFSHDYTVLTGTTQCLVLSFLCHNQGRLLYPPRSTSSIHMEGNCALHCSWHARSTIQSVNFKPQEPV